MPNISWTAILTLAVAYIVVFPLNAWMSQNLDLAPKIGRFLLHSYNMFVWILTMVVWAVWSLLWGVMSFRAAGWWCFALTVIFCQPWNSEPPQLVKFLVAVARPGGSWFTFRPRSPTIVGQRLTAACLRLNGWDDIRRYRDATIEALNSTYKDYYDRDPEVRRALAFWHSMEGIPDFIDDQATRNFHWRERLHVQMKPIMYSALTKITNTISREIYHRLPPMYTSDDDAAPAFDIHVGLMVTNSWIQQVVEPALAIATANIDRELRVIECAKNVDMQPFLEGTVTPAVQRMVDTVLRDIPISFKSAGQRVTDINKNPPPPNRTTIDAASKTRTAVTSPAKGFTPLSPPQSNRKREPRITDEDEDEDKLSSASAPGSPSPMPGGPPVLENDEGEKSLA